MRYVQTACGHRIFQDSGAEVRIRLAGCTVVSVSHDKGFVRLRVPDSAASDLTCLDRQVRGRLLLPRGPWDAGGKVLTVKVARGCQVTTGGECVGRLVDFVAGRGLDAELVLAGAWPGGYMWRAASVTLGPTPELVGGR